MTARIYRVLEVFTDLVYLNLLWMVACLPVVTVAPASAAMFGVVRGWMRGKDTPIAREFFSLFRENFGRSLVVGLVWSGLGAFLAWTSCWSDRWNLSGVPCTWSSWRSPCSTSRRRSSCFPLWPTTSWIGRA